MIVLDRRAYAEEIGEPEELLDPIPQCTPARDGVSWMPFQLMTPTGVPGEWETTFAISGYLTVNGGMFRYGDQRPVFRHCGCVLMTAAGDNLTIRLRT